MSSQITCIGNAIVDVIFPVDSSVLEDLDIVPGSMNLIDQTRRDEILNLTAAPNFTAGGSAANTGAGLATLGSQVSFQGRVANDALGTAYIDSTNQAGVSFRGARHSEGPATGTSVILVTPDGQRTMNTYLGAAADFSEGDLDLNDLAVSDYLFWELYLWDKEAAKNAIRRAMSELKPDAKVALSLSDTFCIDRHRLEVADLIDSSVDVLFGNIAEFDTLLGSQSETERSKSLTDLAEVVIQTDGSNGATVFSGDAVFNVAAVPTELVDSTGAGDQFAAGFLHGLANGANLEHCAQLAVTAASEVVSHYGSRLEAPISLSD